MARKAKNIVWDENYEVEYTNLLVRRALNKAHLNWETCTIQNVDSSYINMDLDGKSYWIKKWNWYSYTNRLGNEKIGMNYTLYKETPKEVQEEMLALNGWCDCGTMVITGHYENKAELYEAIYKN